MKNDLNIGDFILYEDSENHDLYVGNIISLSNDSLEVNPEIAISLREWYTEPETIYYSNIIKILPEIKSIRTQVIELLPQYFI